MKRERHTAPADPSEGADAPRRGELVAVFLFIGLLMGVPLVVVDLYPFSRAPMFADSPQQYCRYEVRDPDGHPLPLEDFGLQRSYWGNPLGVGVGFRPAPTLDHFGEIPSAKEVVCHVRRRLDQQSRFSHVDVTQDVIGPVDEGRIGLVQRRCQRVWATTFVSEEDP